MIYVRYPQLNGCRKDIEQSIVILKDCFRQGGKLLVCGNGGSSADSDHIVGELMKGFLKKRPLTAETRLKLINAGIDEITASGLQGALPAISLTSQTALTSAFGNDADPETVYAQEVYGYGRPGDALMCISSSGNSENIVRAAKTASAIGLYTVALTGREESRLSDICDVTVKVPETETYRVQELHLPVYHYICSRLEEIFFGD